MTAPAPDDPQQSHAPAQQQQKHELAPAAAAAPSAAPMTQAAALSAEEARRARRRVSAEARKRIANACTACKTRKQKCSGERPQCNICRRVSLLRALSPCWRIFGG